MRQATGDALSQPACKDAHTLRVIPGCVRAPDPESSSGVRLLDSNGSAQSAAR